jgi:ATP-dependent RNA helicase DDX46/PRP5
MIDMLSANSGRVTNFKRTTYVVLDEADRMFDMGFEPQVMRIVGNIRPDRQTVMFSATFPRQMEALARKILLKPVEVQVGGRSVVCKDVEQSVIVIEDHQKFFKLLELLGIYHEKGSTLVFVERQETADQLLRDLMKSSYPCLALHGGMDQFDRDSTISDFKNGAVKVLVATSVAARGLDVKQLILVINYDCPNHYEDYVHRCGRTGRAGNKGNAYTFITFEQERYSGDIIKALELSGTSVPSELEDLWTKYTDKLKAAGKIKADVKLRPGMRKKKKLLAIGFGGKGFKFDEKEAAKDAESKLKQKSSLGLADSDDEDQYALLTMDKKLDNIFNNPVQVRDPNAPLIPIQSNNKPGLLPTPPASERLDLAMQIASNIMSAKNIGQPPPQMIAGGAGASLAAQEAASSVMKGGEVQVTGAMLASQIAASINKKVGATPAKVSDTILPLGTIVPGQDPGDAAGPQLKYCDEIEINDFPQQIRFRITTREVLDDIGDYSEAYITVRGIYIPESRQPVEGERRLFLSVEAKSERAVTLAKQEIKRVIKEEAQRMASRVGRHQHSGRYSVL